MLKLQNVSLAFGARPLLKNVNFHFNKGERICLIGRNGEGKSSLLKVISGEILPDSGEIISDSMIKIAVLSQEIPRDLETTVYEVIASGLSDVGRKLSEYQQIIQSIDKDSSLARLDQLQRELDALGAWEYEQSINEVMTRLELPKDQKVSSLSGGWIRRVLLAKALVNKPDLLLLDEPTNHLDIEMIEWLENTLLNFYNGTLLFVSHDRRFLSRVATKIIELDRGNLTEYPGSYEAYLKFKSIERHNEELQNKLFDRRLAEEEVWIRKGVEARRTRNEGRVRALLKMRNERQERIERQGSAKLHFEEASASGKRVLEAENVVYDINGQTLIDNFSVTIQRGDRIGLVGPNGIGKSTLIRLLLGALTPQQGSVIQGTQLEVAYFDQLREDLDEERTVIDNVTDGRDFIEVNGKKRHAISWLQDFLFTPERARSPVRSLSGGERNRLLLARLFSKPFNVLVMDEPTNDLDVETLELLEELLMEFQGTLLLISHDRTFIDNVVTSLLVFTGNGRIMEHIGSYSDWSDRVVVDSNVETIKVNNPSLKEDKRLKKPFNNKKLSYNENRELEGLPACIGNLEHKIAQLENEVQEETFYNAPHEYQREKLEELATLNRTLEETYERWMYLESVEK